MFVISNRKPYPRVDLLPEWVPKSQSSSTFYYPCPTVVPFNLRANWKTYWETHFPTVRHLNCRRCARGWCPSACPAKSSRAPSAWSPTTCSCGRCSRWWTRSGTDVSPSATSWTLSCSSHAATARTSSGRHSVSAHFFRGLFKQISRTPYFSFSLLLGLCSQIYY